MMKVHYYSKHRIERGLKEYGYIGDYHLWVSKADQYEYFRIVHDGKEQRALMKFKKYTASVSFEFLLKISKPLKYNKDNII